MGNALRPRRRGPAMDKRTLLGIAQRAVDESGLDCRPHGASRVPEDATRWCVLFTGGYGRVIVKLWPGDTDELIKYQIAEHLRSRKRGGAKGGEK